MGVSLVLLVFRAVGKCYSQLEARIPVDASPRVPGPTVSSDAVPVGISLLL